MQVITIKIRANKGISLIQSWYLFVFLIKKVHAKEPITPNIIKQSAINAIVMSAKPYGLKSKLAFAPKDRSVP